MAMGSLNDKTSSAPIAEINMVPLVDVMLVLLVIFIITAPLLTNAIKIELPRAAVTPNVASAAQVELTIRKDGSLFWNGAPVTTDILPERFAAAAAQQPQPELHIHADRLAYFESVTKVMSLAGKAGLQRIGFITDPEKD